uniref:Uncharacterized protein n=1 Tax=Chaetoceros debilis TaxID=122233 RepID=A0A7S3VDM3_9STRA|mmetsp:Transcript_21168/g.32171  ORF Transcript_21168/g.32171 Transcript_21168/m.32171 type:complete len:102 (+) Transcript_21168:477-782(+)
MNLSYSFLQHFGLSQTKAPHAGVRTAALLQDFTQSTAFESVHNGCGLSSEPPMNFPNVNMYHIPPNREELMNHFLGQVYPTETNHNKYSAVVFDRFFAEEA